MNTNLFICHASEDKDKFVGPLVASLKKCGYDVWYDEFSLKLGDSLRRTIEKGIMESAYGIVVLSHNFFKKEWPQRELDMLVSLEIGKKHKILPVWLDIEYEDIKNYSPILADKMAIKASDGIEKIISEISKVISGYAFSRKDIDEILERLSTANNAQIKILTYEAFSRLEAYIGFVNEKEKIEIPNWENLSNNEYSKLYFNACNNIRKKYKIPENVWSDADAPIKAYHVENIKSILRTYFRGKLSPEDVYNLYFLLDEDYDMDYLFVLFGIPNDEVKAEDHKYLDAKLLDIGNRNSSNKEFDFEKIYNKIIEKRYMS